MQIDDDDPAVVDEESIYANRRGVLNPPKNMVEREPEREPDHSFLDGNITHNVIDNEKGINSQKNQI